MISCGSNAFGQLNHNGGQNSGLTGDLMSSLLRSTILPLPLDGTLKVETLACGTNISAAIVSHESNLGLDYKKSVCYVWGAGLPGAPLKVPTPLNIRDVRQISCGHTHCGLVTESGLAFTWGAGDNGMLGHGDRHTVTAPKMVAALSKLKAVFISCGSYHTGIIACESADLLTSWIQIPPNGSSISSNYLSGIVSRSEDGHSGSNVEGQGQSLQCGDLYTCGMNRVGQLGHAHSSSEGESVNIPITPKNNGRNFIATPKRVAYFDCVRSDGDRGEPYVVAKVSCGMHHTLMLCVAVSQGKSVGDPFKTSVFSCGWGEHGRLGTGDEEQRGTPTKVEFPGSTATEQPFFAVDVSAGEQHSLAAGLVGAYSWGSNSMGQLGVGSPSNTEMALSPIRIPLPEGMEVKQLAAGGRHSAAITHCGKLLSWGWGEEGQLGGGNEKNAVYPRPVRIPKLRNETSKGVPVVVAVGMSHTVVLLRNDDYEPPQPRLLPVIQEIAEPPPTPPVRSVTPSNTYKAHPPDPDPEPEQAPTGKFGGILFAGEEVEEEAKSMIPTAVRSIRELLQQREGRSQPQSSEGGCKLEPAAEEEEFGSGCELEPETSFAFFLTEQED